MCIGDDNMFGGDNIRYFNEGMQRNCHLQHLTLRQAEEYGVWGESSFTMEDVLVEQCSGGGVGADGIGVPGRCTNVEVRQCGWSGVRASSGASITLIGAKTTVHHNCTYGGSPDYGLRVRDSFSTIQLVSPHDKGTSRHRQRWRWQLGDGWWWWRRSTGREVHAPKTISFTKQTRVLDLKETMILFFTYLSCVCMIL